MNDQLTANKRVIFAVEGTLFRLVLSLICFGDLLIHVAFIVGILVFAHSELGVVVAIVAINVVTTGSFGLGNNNLYAAQFVGINFFAH